MDNTAWKSDFFDYCPDALCVITDGYIERFNTAFIQMFGYHPDQMTGKRALDFIHPDDLAATLSNAIPHVEAGSDLHHFQNRWRCADGQYIWVSWTVRQRTSSTAYCVARDISEIRQAAQARETALRRSEERYRALVQSQSDLVCRFTADTILTFVNEAYARFYNSTPAEMVGRSFLLHIDPATRDGVLERLTQIMRDPAPSVTSFPWLSPTGRTHWVEWVDQGICDEEGNVIEIQAVGREITHLKEIEAALRDQQERYRYLFEVNPMPMWVYDRSTRRFLEVNKAATEKYGYTRDEFMTLQITDIRPEQELGRLNDALKMDTRGFYHGKNWLHKRKDGVVFNVEISSHDVDFNGQPARLVLANDVTDKIAAERALRESEETFRTMLEAASQGVILLDMSGYIRLVNVYIETAFGYDRSELVGQSALFLIPQHMHEEFLRVRREFVKRPMFTRMGEADGLIAQRKDGSLMPMEMTITPITVAGQPMILCLLFDITERKQLEEHRLYVNALEVKLEKDRELIQLKERFISIVSHEFRTPLAVILSSVGILRRYHANLTPQKAAEKLDGIAAQVRRMVQLLEDVLTISQGHAERIEFRPEPLNVEEFCAEIAETIRQTDKEQHPIHITIDDVPVITGDRRLLEHILLNLLTNAAKYSPAGAPIDLGVRRDGRNIIISVQDRGMGIPPEDQDRLFEPFHRAQNVSGLEGTGLGLTIVKQSVVEHGGSISFESSVGHGSTFTVTLPN